MGEQERHGKEDTRMERGDSSFHSYSRSAVNKSFWGPSNPILERQQEENVLGFFLGFEDANSSPGFGA